MEQKSDSAASSWYIPTLAAGDDGHCVKASARGLERIGVPGYQDRHLESIESNSDWVAQAQDLSNSMAAW